MTKHTRRKITPEEQAALMAQYVACINAPRKYKKELISGLLTSIPETLEERVDRTIKFFEKDCSTKILTYIDFGVFIKNNKYFSIGDIAIIYYRNGQAERSPVWGYSSKRKCYIQRYYIQYARFKYDKDFWINPKAQEKQFRNKVSFKILKFPDVLRSCVLTDPAVREFVLERLRAIDAATSGKHG